MTADQTASAIRLAELSFHVEQTKKTALLAQMDLDAFTEKEALKAPVKKRAPRAKTATTTTTTTDKGKEGKGDLKP